MGCREHRVGCVAGHRRSSVSPERAQHCHSRRAAAIDDLYRELRRLEAPGFCTRARPFEVNSISDARASRTVHTPWPSASLRPVVPPLATHERRGPSDPPVCPSACSSSRRRWCFGTTSCVVTHAHIEIVTLLGILCHPCFMPAVARSAVHDAVLRRRRKCVSQGHRGQLHALALVASSRRARDASPGLWRCLGACGRWRCKPSPEAALRSGPLATPESQRRARARARRCAASRQRHSACARAHSHFKPSRSTSVRHDIVHPHLALHAFPCLHPAAAPPTPCVDETALDGVADPCSCLRHLGDVGVRPLATPFCMRTSTLVQGRQNSHVGCSHHLHVAEVCRALGQARI